MKKFITCIIALAVTVIAMAGTSTNSNASSAPTNETVGKIVMKYDKGRTLSVSDYSVLLEYMGNWAKEQSTLQKQIAARGYDVELDKQAEDISERYKYHDKLHNILSKNYSKFGKSNYQKIKKIEKEIGIKYNKDLGVFAW